MTAAAAVNMMAPSTEKPMDVLQPADSPSNRAMISTPVMMMKPGQLTELGITQLSINRATISTPEMIMKPRQLIELGITQIVTTRKNIM